MPSKVRLANCQHFIITPVDDIPHGTRTVNEKWSNDFRVTPKNLQFAGIHYSLRPAFKIGHEHHHRIVQNIRRVEDEFKQFCTLLHMDPLEAYKKILTTYPHRMMPDELFDVLPPGGKPKKRTRRDLLPTITAIF